MTNADIAEAPNGGSNGKIVLLVDRDDGIRSAMKLALRHHAFAVVEARSERQGFFLLRKRDYLDAIILARPAISDGALDEARKLHPAAMLILLTADGSGASTGQDGSGEDRLTFPYPPEPHQIAYTLARRLFDR
jgi:DNA-binding NtrC family response regulator